MILSAFFIASENSVKNFKIIIGQPGFQLTDFIKMELRLYSKAMSRFRLG